MLFFLRLAVDFFVFMFDQQDEDKVWSMYLFSEECCTVGLLNPSLLSISIGNKSEFIHQNWQTRPETQPFLKDFMFSDIFSSLYFIKINGMSYKIFQIDASHSLRLSASICTDMTESVSLNNTKVRMIDYERDNHTINIMGFISCAITSLTVDRVAILNAFLMQIRCFG